LRCLLFFKSSTAKKEIATQMQEALLKFTLKRRRKGSGTHRHPFTVGRTVPSAKGPSACSFPCVFSCVFLACPTMLFLQRRIDGGASSTRVCQRVHIEASGRVAGTRRTVGLRQLIAGRTARTRDLRPQQQIHRQPTGNLRTLGAQQWIDGLTALA
jgi:hypothetical protein